MSLSYFLLVVANNLSVSLPPQFLHCSTYQQSQIYHLMEEISSFFLKPTGNSREVANSLGPLLLPPFSWGLQPTGKDPGRRLTSHALLHPHPWIPPEEQRKRIPLSCFSNGGPYNQPRFQTQNQTPAKQCCGTPVFQVLSFSLPHCVSVPLYRPHDFSSSFTMAELDGKNEPKRKKEKKKKT